jgi:hypothetical protein
LESRNDHASIETIRGIGSASEQSPKHRAGVGICFEGCAGG